MDAQRMKRIMWKIFKELEETQEPIHWKHQLTENQRDVEAYFIFLSLKTSYDYAKNNWKYKRLTTYLNEKILLGKMILWILSVNNFMWEIF